LASSVTNGGANNYYRKGVNYGYVGNSISVANSEIESMEDVPSGTGWKPCKHEVRRDYADSSNVATWGPSSDLQEYRGPNAYWLAWGFTPTAVIPSVESTMFTSSLESQLSKTLERFYDTNQVDNLLNVIESPELPGSLKSLIKTSKRPGVLKALDKVSNGFLAYSFGLAPLLSDMHKMRASASSFRKKLAIAYQHRNQEATVRTSMGGQYSSSTPITGTGGGIATVVANSSLTRTVSVRGMQGPQIQNKVLFAVDNTIRRWVSPGPVYYAWERIPFSFVVDWFFDLHQVFDKVNNLITGDFIVPTQFMVSYKGFIGSSMIDKSTSGGQPAGHYGVSVASTQIEHYSRKLLTAPQTKVTTSGRFGKKQVALSAALLYQQIAKRL
jgi:hypothetical protein